MSIPYTTRTWNPVTGCSWVSRGCDNCYAKRYAETRLRKCARYDSDHPFKVTVHRDRLREPIGWRKPQRMLVCSMGDPFHPLVSDEVRSEIFATMAGAPQHRFLLLTKRARSMIGFWQSVEWELFGTAPELEHIWPGVSVEDQDTADERIPTLISLESEYRWVSIEPLLEPIRLNVALGEIDWLVIGCESGAGARPCEDSWIEDLLNQCWDLNIPAYVKQVQINGKAVKKMGRFPPSLQVRKMPAELRLPQDAEFELDGRY